MILLHVVTTPPQIMVVQHQIHGEEILKQKKILHDLISKIILRMLLTKNPRRNEILAAEYTNLPKAEVEKMINLPIIITKGKVLLPLVLMTVVEVEAAADILLRQVEVIQEEVLHQLLQEAEVDK